MNVSVSDSPPTFRQLFAGPHSIGILVLAMGVLCANVLVPDRFNHDVAFYLTTGNLILDGKRPYLDFYDVNLPLVMYLSAIPALVAKWTGVSVGAVFQLTVAAGCFGSSLLTAWIVAVRMKLAPHAATLVVAGLMLLHTYWFYAGLFDWMSSDFGQREHLFMVAYLPYHALRVAGKDAPIPRCLRVATGIAVGSTILLKPHFLVFGAAAELYWIIRTRSLRSHAAELPAVIASGAVVGSLIALIVPWESWRAYFDRWMPLLRRSYDTAYSIPTSQLLSDRVLLLSAGIVASVLLIGRLRWLYEWLVPLVAGMGLFLLQRKGWTYHRIPMVSFDVMVVLLALTQTAVWWPRIREWILRAVPASLIAAGTLTAVAWPHYRKVSRTRPFLEQIDRHTQPDDTILFLTTSMVPAYPTITLSKRAVGSRWLWTFPIALFHPRIGWPGRSRVRPSLSSPFADEELRLLQELLADIRGSRPEFIFIDDLSPCVGCAPGFRIGEYVRHTILYQELQDNYQRMPDLVYHQVWRRGHQTLRGTRTFAPNRCSAIQ